MSLYKSFTCICPRLPKVPLWDLSEDAKNHNVRLVPDHQKSQSGTGPRLLKIAIWDQSQIAKNHNLGLVPDCIFWKLGVPVYGPRLHFWYPLHTCNNSIYQLFQ